jgi:hypothetical protein
MSVSGCAGLHKPLVAFRSPSRTLLRLQLHAPPLVWSSRQCATAVCASPRSTAGRVRVTQKRRRWSECRFDTSRARFDLHGGQVGREELAQRWWAAATSRRSSLAQPHVTALAPDGRDPCVLDLDSISMADRAATAAPDATHRWRHEVLHRRFGYAAVEAMDVSWRRLRRGDGVGGVSPLELFPSRRRKGAAVVDSSPPDLGRGGRLQLDDLRLASSLARLSPPSLSRRTARVVVKVEVASPSLFL